jgi:hypothetical protein
MDGGYAVRQIMTLQLRMRVKKVLKKITPCELIAA